jgi:hypothetical protein
VRYVWIDIMMNTPLRLNIYAKYKWDNDKCMDIYLRDPWISMDTRLDTSMHGGNDMYN